MLPIFQPYDSYHRYILDTLDMTMLKPLEARTRALERIKESFNFLPRIIGGINPIIPFATRYRAERMLFALTVSLHRALLNFQVERMIRRLSLPSSSLVINDRPAVPRARWSTIVPEHWRSRDYRYRVGVTQWRAWVTEKSLQGDPCSETGITPLATTCRINVITRFARRQVSW